MTAFFTFNAHYNTHFFATMSSEPVCLHSPLRMHTAKACCMHYCTLLYTTVHYCTPSDMYPTSGSTCQPDS